MDMLSKTEIKILEIFVSNITEKFSIKHISEMTNRSYPMIHRAVKSLLKHDYLEKDSHELISLNYKKNHPELAYVEACRTEDFLKKSVVIKLLRNDLLKTLKHEFLVILVFGSHIRNLKKSRDIDILIISDKINEIEKLEGLIEHIASRFSTKFHCTTISTESVIELLNKRDEMNVFNETLNNHIIISGAENYYIMLANGR